MVFRIDVLETTRMRLNVLLKPVPVTALANLAFSWLCILTSEARSIIGVAHNVSSKGAQTM